MKTLVIVIGFLSSSSNLFGQQNNSSYKWKYHTINYFEDIEKATFTVDKVGFGNYRAIKVKGDSMNGGKIKETQDGTIVLARELQAPLVRWL